MEHITTNFSGWEGIAVSRPALLALFLISLAKDGLPNPWHGWLLQSLLYSSF